MEPGTVVIYVCRTLVSVVGTVGNLILLLSLWCRSKVKTFDIFLIGLALANLVETVLVDMVDITLELLNMIPATWFCLTLKFMSGLGETTSILFTVLICIFRYQKLKDAVSRVNFPIPLDTVWVAWVLSGAVWAVAFCFSLPSVLLSHGHDGVYENVSTKCSSSLFECPRSNCSLGHIAYKTTYLGVTNVLPLLIIAIFSIFILKVLLQNRRVAAGELAGEKPLGKTTSTSRRSNISVIAALCIFEVVWILHMIFQYTADVDKFAFWSECDFFISAVYSTGSPYIYGFGNNVFLLRR
ncbi:type-1 angiotensin II receptor B [Erpetoichthys calabaricus]|uniref:type-1 angiotensin II receptor B n=1 Tax=Erpetoichthys calabaricus TaxID=27687 RepID=UPI00109FD2D3|nr:type-1 angiotensin II receptor B [Erpetoichthys calabaricus]